MMGRKTKYDELTQKVNLSLTKTAITSLDRLAERMGVSRSELVEQFARGLIEDNSDSVLTEKLSAI
ncbi:ribbon-helix-helix domain-containing protein [Egbenema bharatensis]|uniref:ribbon-helix-helix domain-containing protein n=1 Tax=Egbenema bharatensis TaxID=3463334 RepID=UPI003A8B4577